ncbi:MAG: hypothetical protein LC792_26065, partial [Actinobacteria bacterium]|nr:hypothetical protein [Actinomycetota bacterium]
PGENEWLRCTTGGHDPTERLAALRRVIFASPSHHERGLAVERDRPNYPENARWEYGGVTFATLHVVGDGDDAGGAQSRRRTAVERWLRETFIAAERDGSAGIVLVWHADPRFGEDAPAYNSLRGTLRAATMAFAKPVVLIHGGGSFRTDQPMRRDDGSRIENFTRVETFGPDDGQWVEGAVDPSKPGVFTFRARPVPDWLT